jgi:nucleotide-binding universal stress UspA family protein
MKATTTKILFPVDFSTHGKQALETAVSLARDQRGELVLLHVEEPPLAYGGGEFYYGLPEPNHDELVRMLNEVVIDAPGVPVQRHVLTGSPGATIVRFAREQGVDTIVMPTHGRTGLLRFLMGSVAEEVVRRAACPVLTVKDAAARKPQSPAAKEHCHV